MLRIFAQNETNERVLIQCEVVHIPLVKIALESKFGGKWIYITQLQAGEILCFNQQHSSINKIAGN